VSLPLKSGPPATTGERWTMVAVDGTIPGGTLGTMSGGYRNADFPLRTIVRYYTDSGDQVGLGPLPPKVGQETIYWAVWNIGPTQVGLGDIKLETVLPPGVTASGKFASELGGDFAVDGQTVRWNLPKGIPPTAGNQATLLFEIKFTPTADMAGKVRPLVGPTKAEGTDAGFGSRLFSDSIPGDDTRLVNDARAKSEGKIE
jgi:hypothetical protein